MGVGKEIRKQERAGKEAAPGCTEVTPCSGKLHHLGGGSLWSMWRGGGGVAEGGSSSSNITISW